MKLFCTHCLKPFESRSPHALYCTVECRKGYAKAEKEHRWKTQQAPWRGGGRPSVGGHCFDLGLQEDRWT